MEPFETIYQKHYNCMYAVAKKMVYDEDSVSDIVQEVFVYLNEQLNKGKSIQYPKSWLYRATTNKCIDYLKNKQRFQSIDELEGHALENTSEAQAEREAQIQKSIRQALGQLKVNERALAVLYSEGLSYKEISEITDIKLSSVGKTLARVLKKLEVELKKHAYELY